MVWGWGGHPILPLIIFFRDIDTNRLCIILYHNYYSLFYFFFYRAELGLVEVWGEGVLPLIWFKYLVCYRISFIPLPRARNGYPNHEYCMTVQPPYMV